ncbi:HAD family hydrolase [Streptomyces sp. NPDC057575]|uniref:HAD family hydrolase n=1 Tax=unclassified Streptomyces TaxID=2593676 RepID=UPI00369E460D
MSGFRLAAVDLDGTLLRSDRTISARTRAAVAQARKADMDVVFVTARHAAAIEGFVSDLDLTGEAVCCIGTAVYELPSATLTWSSPITAAACREISRRISDGFPGLHLGWALESGPLGYQPGYPGPLLMGPSFHADPLSIDGPVLKMWVVGERLGEHRPAELARALTGLADIGHHGRGFADLVAPGVTKAGTLRQLCEARGIEARQVVAFGDAEADLPMLEWAGHGVMMANGRPELHALADEVAPGCDEDGVAVVLERIVRSSIAGGPRPDHR